MTDTLVDISHLDFAYGPRLVLKHIDLRIERGSILGLIGPNGGGKTTLIRLLLDLLRPTRGSIRIDGLPTREAVKRGNLVGYLPQNSMVPRDFPIDVRQTVRLGLAGKTGMLRAYDHQDLEYVETLLRRVGVADFADQPIGSLSG